MGVEDVILRDIEDEQDIGRQTYIDKVLRLRVVKDGADGRLGGDRLFLDILVNYENFETCRLTKIGEELLKPRPSEEKLTIEQKCIGSMEFELDEFIDALSLLKKYGI